MRGKLAKAIRKEARKKCDPKASGLIVNSKTGQIRHTPNSYRTLYQKMKQFYKDMVRNGGRRYAKN